VRHHRTRWPAGVVVEHLADTSIVALDKTGTLTCGMPRVTTIEPLEPDVVDSRRLLQLASAAEQSSEHPLGRAIGEEARMRGIAILPAEDFRALPGRGVRAGVGRDFVEVCSPHTYEGVPLPQLAPILQAGATAAIVAVNGVAVGVLGLTDQLRSDAARSVASLTALTCPPPVLLTGDNGRAARRVARHAGITDVRAALLPEQKVDVVPACRPAVTGCSSWATASTTPPPSPRPARRSRWVPRRIHHHRASWRSTACAC
jgi:cation-transporting P-type ATPase D